MNESLANIEKGTDIATMCLSSVVASCCLPRWHRQGSCRNEKKRYEMTDML